jgi:magnesium transporter
LPLIAQAERSDIRKLLSYPEDSAGAIMTTEYASLPENITVREALDRLRKQAPDSETIYYIYVLDEGRRVQGFVSLRQLILAKPDTKLADLITRDVITVRVDQDREIAAQELARFDFIALPVVDNQNRLVGIVTHDDVLDVLQEEATEDVQRLGAVEPLEGSYLDTPLLTLTWKRGIWLVLLLFAALATAGVLKGYERVSAEFDWMILFIPLVLASGGNAGSQSATLVIRMVALGQTTAQGTLKVAVRELMLASILGGGLSLLGFVIALPLVEVQHAAVVAGTVFLVVVMGTVTGAMLPLAFKRLGMDPALMSNPLIAALVDVLGVIIYYNVTLLFLAS